MSSPGISVERLIKGMAVIIFFGLFLKLGGFLLYYILKLYYPLGRTVDAFTAVYGMAFTLLFFSSALKIIQPVFMPLFSERMRETDERTSWDLANTTINGAIIAGVILAVAACVGAERIVAVLFAEFDTETQRLCVVFLRWLAPALPLTFFAIAAQGILNSYKVFSYPSAGDAVQKLAWVLIFGGALTAIPAERRASLGPHIIGAAFLFACLCQTGVLLWGLRDKLHLYRPRMPLIPGRRLLHEIVWLAVCALIFVIAYKYIMNSASPSDRNFLIITALIGSGCLYAATLWLRGRRKSDFADRIALLAAPLLVGVLFARYRDLTNALFQTYTKEGEFGMIELAKRVANLPNLLVASSLGVAIFPFLCDLAAHKDRRELGLIAGGSVRIIAAILLPITFTLIVLRTPVMRLLFDHLREGAYWSDAEAARAGLALAVLSTSLFFFGIESILMQTFFSIQKTVLPTVLGVIFSVLPSLALYLAISKFGYEEYAFILVCAAWPIGRILKNICLFGFVQAHVPMITMSEGARFVGKLAVLCAAPAAAAWALERWIVVAVPLQHYATRAMKFELAKAVHVAVPGAVACVIFLLLCILLKLEEFHNVVRFIKDKAWRRGGKSGAAAGDL